MSYTRKKYRLIEYRNSHFLFWPSICDANDRHNMTCIEKAVKIPTAYYGALSLISEQTS